MNVDVLLHEILKGKFAQVSRQIDMLLNDHPLTSVEKQELSEFSSAMAVSAAATHPSMQAVMPVPDEFPADPMAGMDPPLVGSFNDLEELIGVDKFAEALGGKVQTPEVTGEGAVEVEVSEDVTTLPTDDTKE